MIEDQAPELIEAMLRLRRDKDFQLLMTHLDKTIAQAKEAAISRNATLWDAGYVSGLIELPKALERAPARFKDLKRSTIPRAARQAQPRDR